ANPATSAPATAPGNQPGSMNARPAATAQPGSVKPGDKKAAAKPQFPVAGPVSHTLQRITGVTWLGEVVANQVAKKALQKKLGGKAKVKVTAYSLTDLIAGKVKAVQVKMVGSNVKNIPLGEVKLATDNPFWYDYHRKEGRIQGLQNPLLLSVEGHLAQDDVTNALASPRVTKQLRGLKLDLPGLGEQQLQVVRPKVQLSKGLVYIDALLVTEGAAEDTGVPIKISGRPELAGDKIVLKDMKVDSPYIVEPEKFAAFSEELLNPIVDFSRLDRKDHAFRLKNLAVLDDSVDGGGQLLLVPKSKTN
ncbi:MAG TPA: LmeA family phospholipid-binding protein, partial [Chroococcales cyanobacterium]